MTKLVLKTPGSALDAIELQPGVTRLGRSEDNDYLLEDPGVSERHCEIMVTGDYIIVRDLGSTNGTFIDEQPVTECAIRGGQTLRIGPVEMILHAPEIHLSIPALPALETPLPEASGKLADGHDACLNHEGRHAAWRCVHCRRQYCEECVRRLRRVGGAYLRLCPACSHHCELTPWSESLRRRKRSILAKLADKVKTGFKQTTRLIRTPARRKGPAEDGSRKA